MGQIRQMEEQLATLIAAGEVITGPAAVVRELIDNAIDAGARTIDIALEEGGLRTIRVADDGCGMDRSDAVLCVSPHATSKITAVDDLETLRTLGFRGEALAAILSVSRLRIETRREEEDIGTVALGAGGEILDVRPGARRPGTTVEVTRLFFNTPARREFQDSSRAESGRVLQAVHRAALANPSVRFTLREGRRELHDLVPAGELLERIRQVHGSEFADALLPVAAARGEVSVSGFVSHPAAAVRRARRNAFAVNGRPIESFEIRRLLATTFSPLVTGGSHVEAILRIRLPQRDVDANVSPDKSQVRFRRPGQVFATVNDALRGALGEEEAIVRLAEAGSPRSVPFTTSGGAAHALSQGAQLSVCAPSGPLDPWAFLFGGTPGVAAPESLSLHFQPRHGIPAQPAFLVQLHGMFLLCPAPEGLLIVDQHSAHERVHYERLRERLRRLGHNPEVQSLIFPEPLRVDAEEGQLLTEMDPFLRRLGFDLVTAGPHDLLVQSAPAALTGRTVAGAIRALMEIYSGGRELGVRSGELSERLDAVQESMLRSLACHAAVKAGQPLSDSEIRALWAALVQVELAGHDVHGRPAILLLEQAEIVRRMGRGG